MNKDMVLISVLTFIWCLYWYQYAGLTLCHIFVF